MTQFNARALYDIYFVEIQIRDKICGGMPKNKDLIEAWVKSTTKYNDEQTIAQTDEARAVLLEEVTERSWNGFPGDENGIFLWARQIKALFKECATMLRLTVAKSGSKQILQHGFEIKSPDAKAVNADRIYLHGAVPATDRSPCGVVGPKPKADGFYEGPIHVQTAQGPRSAIKRVDYVEKALVKFEVWVLATAAGESRHVGRKELEKMLTFGQENGLGADRSQGMGKFNVVKFEQTQAAEKATFDAPKKEGKKGKNSAPEEEAEAN